MLVWILGCETETKLTFETQQLQNEKCKTCPEIKIKIPHALDESRIAETINTALTEELIYVLKFDDTDEVSTLKGAMESFTKSYQDFQEKFDDEAIGWEAEIIGKVTYEKGSILSIVLDIHIFTGGAHGYAASTFLNFDKLESVELEQHELFKDFEGFIGLAEAQFREEQEIPLEGNINATGFMFSGDTFHLAENLGFTDEGVQIIYNQYEVASYADGPIELIIPFGEASPFLKDKYVVIN